MIEPFAFIRGGIDVAPIMAEIDQHPELWGQQTARLGIGSPHAESKDIWLRYRDPDAYVAEHGADMSHFCDAHKSEWLSPIDHLPSAGRLAHELAACRRLGGVLLTHLPPGARISPHVDHGWHAEQHDKLYVALRISDGALFCWENGVIRATDGDVYQFRNDISHWVENPTDSERISMIVCLRKEAA